MTSIDLKKLDNMLDEALEKETKESLNQWLSEKDTEDPVIQGWMAIDEAYGKAFLHAKKPILKNQPIADTGNYNCIWHSDSKKYLLDAGVRREEMWISYFKQIKRTGLSSCRYYACNSCERGTRKKCTAERISDCKYYQPRKHGGKKK